MSCLPYIANSNFSQNIKDRMHIVHTDIYNTLKTVKGIKRHNSGFLYIPAQQSNEYRANAISSIAKFNKENKVISLVNREVDNKVFEVVKIDVTPLGIKYDAESRDEFYQVDYTLKTVKILNDNLSRIVNLYNKMGNSEDFWTKIQKDFQIPKDQLNLLRESEGNNIEEKLASFMANYSYAIEINTAKIKKVESKDTFSDQSFTYNNRFYESSLEPIAEGEKRFYYKDDQEISEEEFNSAFNEVSKDNSQYYSNLTVPGGTNYTEQEIATPAIIPSIKGHAQFATDKGIGWFRSDDKHTFTGFLEDLIASGTIKKVLCG